eukprot:CAMPEP_0172759094 /NCGR_PEP_ID=MMETSP1074-20121228/167054_1 /TAXON_ID=2916 /ORGANISM="Ceratium fusus, Strain PA161109" /LENGTH=66 /DNA_ID=CAMNT_0013592815 /DNA_START=398 /DNA_END=595 /DNA_ORIENTATION=+
MKFLWHQTQLAGTTLLHNMDPKSPTSQAAANIGKPRAQAAARETTLTRQSPRLVHQTDGTKSLGPL